VLQCGYDYGSYLSVLLGTGDGSFAASFALDGFFYYGEKVVAEDFNADGNLDLAVGGGLATPELGGGVAILLGAGNGTFSAPQYYDYLGGSALAVADFNGDGKPDLATQGYSQGISGVEVLAGNGDGSFGPPRSYPVGYLVTSLATADVNQDGRPDLITGDFGVSVLLADGAGGFHSPIVHAAGPDSGYNSPVVATGDFNGDARPDVGVASIKFSLAPGGTNSVAVHNVRVLLNDGAWTPPPPPISISDVTVTEGNSGAQPATFTVRLSRASDAPVTVTFATADGTATAGSDYQATSGTLTFAPGETEKTITVPVNGDRLGEANEQFSLLLASPGSNQVVAMASATIVDDEPRISIGDVAQVEGKRGQTTLFTFTVTLSAPYDQAVTMSFGTVDGTAKTGNSDYIARAGTLTFAPGETTKTITIEVKGDNRREAMEHFYLDLFGNSGNALFTKNRGIGTILNDD
jgi:Calx-beta domain/FG-GAP-like repeat